MTLLILIIGGVTRLTQSGLSMVDWRPITGVVPPLSEAAWEEAFAAYRQFPEYQKLRPHMTLSEFQFIFFWEFLHRFAARSIGLLFLLPFAFFWIRGYLSPPLLKRGLALFALGGMQGLMGWLMVKSGLVDQPHVSHYRLAAHLLLAFLIFGGWLWLAAELRLSPVNERVTERVTERAQLGLRRGVWLLGALLGLQVLWGALVAGLKAGLLFNTFPLMGGGLIPPNLFGPVSVVANFFENPVAVQWTHRVLGTALALGALGVYLRARSPTTDRESRRWAAIFVTMVFVQYLLGVLTLLYLVPVHLGVIHQAVAMLIFGVWVLWLHHVRRLPVKMGVTAG